MSTSPSEGKDLGKFESVLEKLQKGISDDTSEGESKEDSAVGSVRKSGVPISTRDVTKEELTNFIQELHEQYNNVTAFFSFSAVEMEEMEISPPNYMRILEINNFMHTINTKIAIIDDQSELITMGEALESFIYTLIERIKNEILNTYDDVFTYIMDNIPDDLKEQLGRLSLTDFSVLKEFTADAHGDTLPPILINIKDKEFVLKSRDSHIESRILKLFRDINDVIKKKGLYNGASLPVFNIYICGKYSLADYIDGTMEQMGVGFSKGKISKLHKKKKIIIDNLALLEIVASKINLTDLHRENVIFKDIHFYPIDLEALSLNDTTSTGLFIEDKTLLESEIPEELDEEIERLIEGFIEDKKDLPHRILPIPTGTFQDFNSGIINIDEIEHYIERNIPELTDDEDKGYYGITKKELIDYINDCKDKNIIPYFILDGDTIRFKKGYQDEKKE